MRPVIVSRITHAPGEASVHVHGLGVKESESLVNEILAGRFNSHSRPVLECTGIVTELDMDGRPHYTHDGALCPIHEP